MRQISNLLMILSVVLFVGCSSNKDLSQTSKGDVPDWYLNPPKADGYLYGVYTASSRDMQLSVDKASVGANQELAKQLEIQVQSLQKKFEEEVGVGENSQLLQQFTQVTRQVVNQKLSGNRVKERKLVQSGELWRAYVLMEYPLAEANKALLDGLKSQEQLLTRIRSTKTFQELDAAVSKQGQTE